MNHMVLHVCVIYLLNDYTSFLIHHLPLVCLAKSELDLLYFRRFKTFTEQQNFSYLEAFGPHLRPCSPQMWGGGNGWCHSRGLANWYLSSTNEEGNLKKWGSHFPIHKIYSNLMFCFLKNYENPKLLIILTKWLCNQTEILWESVISMKSCLPDQGQERHLTIGYGDSWH